MNASATKQSRVPALLHRTVDYLLNYGSYAVGVVIIVVFSFLSPYYFTVNNILGMLRDSTPLLCASIGMTFVVMSGKMDLSIGSIMLCSASICGVLVAKAGVPPYLAMLLCILAGGLMGAINGFFIAVLKMNPWLVTLSMKLGLRGLALFLTSSAVIVMPQAMTVIRDARFLGINVVIILSLLLVALAQIGLRRTTFGRDVMAVGSNEAAAGRIGVSITRVRFLVYVLCGVFAGVGSIMMNVNLGVVGPTSGAGYEFTCAMVIVLGGSSLAGGRGSVFPGTLVGVVILAALENGLYIIGINPYWFGVIRGIIIFYAMYVDSIKNKKMI